MLPGVDVAVNVEEVVPAAPAVYVTVANALPAVAVTLVGAPGAKPEVTLPDGNEYGPVMPLETHLT
jgi:hypothetical protein